MDPEREDYDDGPGHKRGATLLTPILVAVIAAAVLFGGFMALEVLIRSLELIPPDL